MFYFIYCKLFDFENIDELVLHLTSINISYYNIAKELKVQSFLGGDAFWGVGVLMTLDQLQYILMLMWLNVLFNVLFGLTGKT